MKWVSGAVTTWLIASTLLAQDATPVWFKVGRSIPDPGRNETYLVQLSKPEHIAHARALARKDPDATADLVMAHILPGSDGFNRDLDAPGQPLWNWYIAEFLGFSEGAIELCDGWPGLIEADPLAFVLNTGNQICFWSFTVVDEVKEPLGYGIHAGLSSAWYELGKGGQGMFIQIDSILRLIFVGWFTFDTMGTPDVTGQRWYTAQGGYTGETAILDLAVTTGGRFDAPDPVIRTGPGEVGTLELNFADCNNGTATYRFEGGAERAVPIVRLPAVERC